MSSQELQQVKDHFVPQVNNNTYYYNQKTNKHYFKVFLMNNLFNKRKFRVSNLFNLNKDIDGYENLPVTFVADGFRKGNHPNPKDANIFEANYQNKHTYITKAIDYYRTFGIAKIVKIYKPDSNILTASASNPENILNYFALCETEHPKMIEMLQQVQKEKDKKIYVSPAMLSWDWIKNHNTEHVDVNSFVPTHLAIVDKPAYDPEIAYIKKETCQKDGTSCYYELLEASELENLNNNNIQTNNMSTQGNQIPTTLEEYIKSYYSYDVIDTKNVNAEDLVRNLGNLLIIDKNKTLANSKPVTNEPVPIPPAKQEEVKTVPVPPVKQEEVKVTTAEKKEEKSSNNNNKNSFTLEDVQKLLVQQEERILSRINAEKTKGERDQILGTFFDNNDKIKSVKDKIDADKLNKEKELYNTLPFDNEQLKRLLNNSIYNPKHANSDVIVSVLAAVARTEQENKQQEQNNTGQPKGIVQPNNNKNNTNPNNNAPVPNPNTIINPKPITDIPPKSIPNINGYGTEFKSSAQNSNKYNDNYKGNGKSFSAAELEKENRPTPTTGEGIPKKFQKYIQ